VGCTEPWQKGHRSCSCSSSSRWIIEIWHNWILRDKRISLKTHFKTIWQWSIRKCGWVLNLHTKMKRENSSNILNLSSLDRMNFCQVAGARVWWVVGSCTMDWYEMVKPLLLVRVRVLVHPRTFFIIHCSSSDSYLLQFHYECKYHPTEHFRLLATKNPNL
jgi:hypothetical protein